MTNKNTKSPHDCHCRELNWRQFFTSVGPGAVTFAVAGSAISQHEPPSRREPTSAMTIALQVNGQRHTLVVEPRWSLLYVLREKLGITAPKEGCERGECGACTVLIDQSPHYACMMLAVEAEDRNITTPEGLMDGERLGPVQQAFLEQDAYQRGYCTPGQIMAVEGLLRADPEPSLDRIRLGVSGNLCRCGAYANIFKAVGRAAEIKRSSGGVP